MNTSTTRRNESAHLSRTIIIVALMALLLGSVAERARAQAPANDDFADATVIAGVPFGDALDDTLATTEADEPPTCYFYARTVWYSFTPTADIVLKADMVGSSFYDTYLSIYQAAGAGFASLSEVSCTGYGNAGISFVAQAGTTYYFQAGDSIYGSGGLLQFTLQQVPPPPNDEFANAVAVTALPFLDDVDTTAASHETDEPVPSCTSGYPFTGTVWYAFTPAASGLVSATMSSAQVYYPLLAAYTGDSLESLTEMSCVSFNSPALLNFHANVGTTYFFQVAGMIGLSGPLQFELYATPPPAAGFGSYPYDPSIFDTVGFYDTSGDPGGVGFQSFTWDFGDGATDTGYGATHRYAADGDYNVQHTVTTVDGRTASVSQRVRVETHDVAIVKRSVPRTARAGQTHRISVRVKSKRRPEVVQVQLFSSVAGTDSFALIGTLTLFTPARRANRTTPFDFTYTYTSADADVGKVTFQAVATIMGGVRDALPADNEAIATTTRVRR